MLKNFIAMHIALDQDVSLIRSGGAGTCSQGILLIVFFFGILGVQHILSGFDTVQIVIADFCIYSCLLFRICQWSQVKTFCTRKTDFAKEWT